MAKQVKKVTGKKVTATQSPSSKSSKSPQRILTAEGWKRLMMSPPTKKK